MPPREPTRHQISSRLAYNSQTPSFLLKLQNQVAGRAPEDDEDEPQYLDGVDEFGRERRPPVSERPPIPERPEQDERGSDNEDDEDEKPVVVVLKEGKHLSELEAKNEKRIAEGLLPLPAEPERSKTPVPQNDKMADPSPRVTDSSGLSFSSKKSQQKMSIALKRKAPDGNDKPEQSKQSSKKKAKKDKKGLLSFDQGDIG